MKCIIFDLDQTLIDRSATFRLFIHHQYLRHRSVLKCAETMYQNAILQLDDNGYKDKKTMFQEVCEQLNLTINPETLFDDFKLYYGLEPILFEGVFEMLDELKQDYRLAIITNGRVKAQATKIRVSGLENYFEVVTISEAVGYKKPAPEIFHHCLSELKLSAEGCVYIGDNPRNDVEAAMAVGMKGIWVKNTHFTPPLKSDGIIDSYADLKDCLSAF